MAENKDKVFSNTVINYYPGHMYKTKKEISTIMSNIDVVIEVIDSRIPYSSRIPDLDNLTRNKKRIIVFNKYDLCDKDETNKWVKYYELLGYKVLCLDLEKTTNLSNLINLTNSIMEEENNKRIEKGLQKRKTRVLVVGIPNVGKSTLINRLSGKKVANVGNAPGITKNLSWIRVSNDVELMDTPGILWPKFDSEEISLNLASLTAIKEEVLPIDRVVIYILNMLDKYYNNILQDRYGIDHVDNEEIEETLEAIGRKRGCLQRGGIVDYDKVYSVVMNDIKNGIIKGITFDRSNS